MTASYKERPDLYEFDSQPLRKSSVRVPAIPALRKPAPKPSPPRSA